MPDSVESIFATLCGLDVEGERYKHPETGNIEWCTNLVLPASLSFVMHHTNRLCESWHLKMVIASPSPLTCEVTFFNADYHHTETATGPGAVNLAMMRSVVAAEEVCGAVQEAL